MYTHLKMEQRLQNVLWKNYTTQSLGLFDDSICVMRITPWTNIVHIIVIVSSINSRRVSKRDIRARNSHYCAKRFLLQLYNILV